jgi:hypothetical protein
VPLWYEAVVNELPAEAEMLVSRIEALLAQAEPLLDAAVGGEEAAYALRETERRYLPDTVKSFLDIPPARRDANAFSMLVDQLRLLERATAQRLAVLSDAAETAQKAHGRFLTARFGPADSLPKAPATVGGENAPTALLVRRALDRLEVQSGADAGALIARAAAQLTAAFPVLATVHRSGFLGRGDVDAVWLDVPRRDDLLRYALAHAQHAGIAATVTRFLRGIKNRTVTVELGEWTEGLIADLTAYVERERGARETLNRLFRETR